jgi:hypothetical protein
MKHLIFAGDSHTGIFRDFAGPRHSQLFRAFRDDTLAINHLGALTMDAFSRKNSPAYKSLTDFLALINFKGCSLVLCLSEIDVRVHYWRDMPLLQARGMTFEAFLQAKVDSFIARVDELAGEMQLASIILWGAPASQLASTQGTADLPVTGDNQTRNIVTHMLNSCIIKAISNRTCKLRFSTPFYGMVSDDFVTNTTWLHDGIHLNFALREHCFELLESVVDQSTLATFAPNFYELQHSKFELQSLAREQADIANAPFFRTWLQSETPSALSLTNEFGQFSLVQTLSEVGEKSRYHELVLRKTT